MKKIFRLLSVLLVLLIVITSSAFAAGAKVILDLYGYSYTILSDSSISICGWDNSSPEFSVPNMIMSRYVTEVDARALQDNDYITSVDFSKTTRLDYIGFYSFENCNSISNDLIIPETVTTIREGAFMNCSSIPNIIINANVSEIERESFSGCVSLQTVVLPDSLTDIGIYAFGNCTNLCRVDIPKSVNHIADSAFDDDPNLILCVYTDTAGHNYAAEKNMPYILLDGPKLGDANGDGVIDILDSTEIQKYATEKTDFTDEQFELADINNDGFVDVIDALLVQKCVVGKYDIPPIIYNS